MDSCLGLGVVLGYTAPHVVQGAEVQVYNVHCGWPWCGVKLNICVYVPSQNTGVCVHLGLFSSHWLQAVPQESTLQGAAASGMSGSFMSWCCNDMFHY